jgi:hypothetical protein
MTGLYGEHGAQAEQQAAGRNITEQAGMNGQAPAAPPPLKLTTARWFNRKRRVRDPDPRGGEPGYYDRWAKVLAHEGPLTQFAYGTDTPSRQNRPVQKCIICAPHTGVIGGDIDSWSRLAPTPLGRLLAAHRPIDIRLGGERRHYLLDGRGVPAEQWPAQGALYGDSGIGHIKSNGWIPVPGSEHHSGELYEPVIGPGGTTCVIMATPELMATIAEAVSVPSVNGGSGNGGGGHGNGRPPLPPTEVLLEQGVPHPHDDNMLRLAGRLCAQGKTKAEAHQVWRAVADKTQDPGYPFTSTGRDNDFDRHWDGAAEKGYAPPGVPAGGAEWAQGSAESAATADGSQAPSPGPAQRPSIDCGSGHGPETIRGVQAALNAQQIPHTYVTDGRVVILEQVSGSREMVSADVSRPLPAVVTEAAAPILASLLANHTYTYMWAKEGRGKAATRTPQEFTPAATNLTAALAPRSWPGLRPLTGVIGAPVLRPDGTLLQAPGYDSATGLYLAGRVHAGQVPAQPSAEELAWARHLLFQQVLHDFPWRGPADMANYAAMLVTQVLRHYLRGAPVPFFPVTATGPSSGKTLLITIAGVLFGQVKLVWTGDDEELRKVLTTVMRGQEGVIAFDNIPEGTTIRSAVLSKLLTDRTWGDRLLGGNALAKFANDRLWTGSGNNLRIGGDMATRAVLIAIDPKMPHPERRSGFTIGDLEGWIEEPGNQRHLLEALLVLVADWAAAGCPEAEVVPMRQFTKWARVTGGFLARHGVSGRCRTCGAQPRAR